MFPRMPGFPKDFRQLLYQLGVGSVVWNAAAIAFPLLLWRARRVDAERNGRLYAVALSAVVVALLFVVTTGIEYLLMFRGAPSRPGILMYVPTALRQNLVPCIALVGVVAAVEARRRARHAAVERERLRAQVAEQRLIALTGQLQPHFLFNTLQGISTLIHRDAEAADEMLAKLSDLLRDLLRHRDHAFVSLADELQYTRTYLEIAQLRFADRLTFDIDSAPELRTASVPLFVLQPLLENALTHGIGIRASGGRVVVRIARVGDELILEVLDDGAGLPTAQPMREGIGLTNTRERLLASFGEAQRLTVESIDSGGVITRVVIPFRLYARER